MRLELIAEQIQIYLILIESIQFNIEKIKQN